MDFELLFEILRCALSGKLYIGTLTEKQLEEVLKQAEEQAIFGLIFNAIHNAEIVDKNDAIEGDISKAQMAIFEAVGLQEQIKQQNEIVNDRAEMLTHIFASWGYRTCILKGQGIAQLYPKPLLRQSGDIDIWVDGKQDDIISCLRHNYFGIRNIDYVHSSTSFFTDVEVEVHFRPSWMYNPFSNKKLQKYFIANKEQQFAQMDEKVGFSYPTIGFNLVYSLIHIYRHIFEEGIGLRQLVDYYYILTNSSCEQRKVAYPVLDSLKMKNFCGGIMWILKEKFGMKDEYLLCPCNNQHGKFLLSEIMTAGNFGQYDARIKRIDVEKRFARGFVQLKRNLRFVRYYPSEVLWSPFWKLWHWCWRKQKGYL